MRQGAGVQHERRWLPAAMAVLWACGLACAPAAAQSGKPNFVIMMADDLGYNDVSMHGNPDVETPNLAAFAADSVELAQFYAHPVCAPTRASLLTGRHFLRTGVWGVHGTRDYINLDERTFGDVLGGMGYKTGLFGKWHNGVTDGYLPWDRGFQDACMVHLYDYWDNEAVCNGQPVSTKGWATDVIIDWSINFIEENKDQPFVLYTPFMAPHLGIQESGPEYWHAPQYLVDKYKGKGLSDGLARLYGMIENLDVQVGRLLQRLDDLGLAENTLVMFFSDNGPGGNQKLPFSEWQRRNPDGLNGNKGEVFENGIRVPMYMRWRGRAPPAVVQSALVSVMDVFPTMLDLAGGGTSGLALDGKSFAPLLFNPTSVGEEWSGRTLYHTISAPEWTRRGGEFVLLPDWGRDKSGLTLGRESRWAVRQGRYKLVNLAGYEFLYDLENDPVERNAIHDNGRLSSMHDLLASWWREMVDDPGSFSTPTLIIGASSASVVMPMGAVTKSEAFKVRDHNVEGWVSYGDHLDYKLNVIKVGDYLASVSRWGDWGGELKLEIECGGALVAQKQGWVPKDGVATLGSIHIPNTGSCVLKVRVASGQGWLGMDKVTFASSKDAAQQDPPPALSPSKRITQPPIPEKADELQEPAQAPQQESPPPQQELPVPPPLPPASPPASPPLEQPALPPPEQPALPPPTEPPALPQPSEPPATTSFTPLSELFPIQPAPSSPTSAALPPAAPSPFPSPQPTQQLPLPAPAPAAPSTPPTAAPPFELTPDPLQAPAAQDFSTLQQPQEEQRSPTAPGPFGGSADPPQTSADQEFPVLQKPEEGRSTATGPTIVDFLTEEKLSIAQDQAVGRKLLLS